MKKENTTGEHWKVFALFFKNAMESKGMNQSQLVKEINKNRASDVKAHRSTIKRFFDLESCAKFDTVLEVSEALGLNIEFKKKRVSKTNQ